MENILRKHGFEHFGVTDVKPMSFEYYQQWLEAGFHGDMEYLSRHAEFKANPRLLLKSARSAIVVTKSYVPHPSLGNKKEWHLPVARYARGEDYHLWMMKSLREVCADLNAQIGETEFFPFVDTSAILERDFALRAGLGWIGKNACLIDQKRGSYFFIGGILTSLELENLSSIMSGGDQSKISSNFSARIVQDRCGTCTRCMDACPTGAIIAEKTLDAKKCISYLTIEARENPPAQLRDFIDSYFGCDICQMVCPWNRAIDVEDHSASESRENSKLIEELRFILLASNRQIERHFAGSALMRASANGHRRNAIVLVANMGITELQEEISRYETHPKLGELALWATKKLCAVSLERVPNGKDYAREHGLADF